MSSSLMFLKISCTFRREGGGREEGGTREAGHMVVGEHGLGGGGGSRPRRLRCRRPSLAGVVSIGTRHTPTCRNTAMCWGKFCMEDVVTAVVRADMFKMEKRK